MRDGRGGSCCAGGAGYATGAVISLRIRSPSALSAKNLAALPSESIEPSSGIWSSRTGWMRLATSAISQGGALIASASNSGLMIGLYMSLLIPRPA